MTKHQEVELFKLIDEYSCECDGGTREDIDKARQDVIIFVERLEECALKLGLAGETAWIRR